MKRVCLSILALAIMAAMAACGGNTPPKESIGQDRPVQSNTLNGIQSDVLSNDQFIRCVKVAFEDIGIEINSSEVEVTRDTETSGVRSVGIKVNYEDRAFLFSCFFTEEEWHPVSISDANTKNYYWLAESVKEYGDIYDWKTGEIKSHLSEEFPDNFSSYTPEPVNTSFLLVLTYDEDNVCTLKTIIEDDEISFTGTCDFDGKDMEIEALRSLAFTTYCVQNAEVFSNGNLTMLYYSGEDDGFASYKNGELGLSDFPDRWNEYSSSITQEQIEAELQNIIDNIESVE